MSQLAANPAVAGRQLVKKLPVTALAAFGFALAMVRDIDTATLTDSFFDVDGACGGKG